jgi:hypothetical protein
MCLLDAEADYNRSKTGIYLSINLSLYQSKPIYLSKTEKIASSIQGIYISIYVYVYLSISLYLHIYI